MATIKYPFTYKIGRNSPCPCASGKKFKHCCSPHLEAGLKEKASELFEAGKFAEAQGHLKGSGNRNKVLTSVACLR
jgi:hypothetical protein